MSVVMQEPPEKAPTGFTPLADAQSSGATGLKPIQRMMSADRLARIHPETLAQTELRYSSVFARDFLRSDYNFCASKMTIARDGKLAAIDAEFRVAETWFKKANAFFELRPKRSVAVQPEAITLEIKHPLSGRLVRVVTLYDRLFIRTLEGLMAQSVSSHERENALNSAESRIKKIAWLCIPDSDQFTPEGTLLLEGSGH
jgi:hypothetical protein